MVAVKKKIKLLVCIPYYYPHIGGMEKHVANILFGLNKFYDYEIIVVTSMEPVGSASVEVKDGVKIYRLPISFKISNTPIGFTWYNSLNQIIIDEKPDLINGRGPVPFMADIAFFLAKKHKIPFVLGWHFPSMRKQNILFDIPIFLYEYFFLQNMIKNSHSVICSSETVYENLVKSKTDRGVVITQGINSDIFKPLNLKRKKNSVLFVGNFETDVKGLTYLLYAIEVLAKKYPKIQLNIVGTGNVSKYKNLSKQLHIDKNVNFIGVLEKTDLAREYSSNEIFVCPSIVENFPSTVLEAIFCQTAVIATDVGDIAKIIKNNETGLLITKQNVADLVASITLLIKDINFREKLAINAFNLVQNDYSWESRINLTNNVILRTLEGNTDAGI